MHQNRTRWGAYSAPPDPLAAFDGLTSKRGEGMMGRRREGRGEKGGEMLRTFYEKFLATPLIFYDSRPTSLIR